MISVITPCLNIISGGREDWFEKMMKSIHEQSYKNIEHIIIDGGSTDSTRALVEKYIEKGWVSHFQTQSGEGIYNAINDGLQLANGEYINIMNTDDYFTDEDFFMISVSKINNTKADFTHADRIIESKEDGSTYIKKGNEKTAFFRMPFRHQTMIVRREVFDEIGLFDENYKIASDYKYVLKMLLAGKKGLHIPKTFVYSLDGGVSSDRNLCIKEVSQVIYEVYGKKYGLTLNDCRDIYTKNVPLFLFLKIIAKIKNKIIRNSLIYGYFKEFRTK